MSGTIKKRELITVRPAAAALLNVTSMNKCGGTHVISLTGIFLSQILRQTVCFQLVLSTKSLQAPNSLVIISFHKI